MTESGDTDPTTPKAMQQNEPNPTDANENRDDEAGEKEFVEEAESDPARAGNDSEGHNLHGG